MRCTSINVCKHGNFQIDHFGSKNDCYSRFEDWCITNDPIWSKLFDVRTGELVATYGSSGLMIR